jgi:hypothetical protein
MEHQPISYVLRSSSRDSVHREIIELFLNEEHGLDSAGHKMAYTYLVDSVAGWSIVLSRPARLNRGMNFVVSTFPKIPFQKYKKGTFRFVPTQNDVISLLGEAQKSMGPQYARVSRSIEQIFNCGAPSFADAGVCVHDAAGNSFPVIVVLLLVKWLFTEQDVTYWNYSGREMLFNALKKANLL